ncbi:MULTISPECIES: LytTR family DNA-binding domain-containing protein [Asticcacaulis]|uniref:LytTR family DNA-binding domain-containing protein n=1 Tax=Asticcacaulis TaxID=76890 RepID=UPI001AE6C4B0|nr:MULTISPECIES: LytTR family DNA-binding domain-containing protein [Asticcacaulis]MBP2160111.1 DNA-binding LytR/AlgR family response regulator [Asticcacaulis solisilvae]MDR6801156.1 DNA-binding LytR/AlgR family response regulator [Asticcacaulis sp. BE141]
MRETPDQMREMPAPAIGASPVAGLINIVTHPWGERQWLRVYSVAIAMAFFLSFTGAMGSQDAPIAVRMGYWLATMLGGTVAVQLVSLVLHRFRALEPLAGAIVLFVLAVPAVTLSVWLIDGLYFRHGLDPRMILYTVRPVTVITLAMSVLQYLLERTPRQSHVHPEADRKEPAQAFRGRLPFKYQKAEIHALSAEDHYLRVHTSVGQTLLLMRLYDAIRELDGIEGSQVHRSWWVARDAVSDVMRSDGRVTLALKGDVEAPVSRSYAKVLRAEGWF